VPLHEIPAAFLLSAEEFLAKYGFSLPEKEAKNTVLTCRYRG
jgi:N-acetylglutamate synthase-like GNAT family acetyltransferase